jgi:hypothetical protein
MEKSGHNTSPVPVQALEAIIIGRFTDDFVHFTMNLLSKHGIEFVLCEDIYWASCELAEKANTSVLVISRVEQLCREKGRFLSKIKERGFACCCIAESCSTQKLKLLIEAGVFVINAPAQIGEIIMNLSANKASEFNRNKFITTKAEIDALLGT